MTRFGSLLRASFIVFLFLISAKVLNFFKKILIGNLFGVSWVADAFFAASYLPYYLAIFFEGVIFLGFLPLFSKMVAEKGKEEADQFIGQIFILIFGITLAWVGLAVWAAPWFIRELVPGFSFEEQNLTRHLFQILSALVVLISLRSFFQALNSYFGSSAVAASAGLVDSAAMVGLVLLTWKIWGIEGAAWSAVGGALAVLVFQAGFLFSRGVIRPRLFNFQMKWLGAFSSLLIPMALIWFFQQVPLILFNRFGSGMWEGTISALTIAHTLTTVPMGLVSHTILFAVFPSLAKQANEQRSESARETFFQTLRGGFFVLIPVGFLLTALAHPLANLFFDGGGISAEGTQRIANSLAGFGWATFALYADLFMTQSLIAVRKPWPAIFLCASRAVLTYGLGYFLSSVWDYQGLALSFSLALVLNFFVLFPFFFQWSPFREKWGSLFLYAAKIILSSGPLLLGAWFVNHGPFALWMSSSKVALALGLAFVVLGSSIVYLSMVTWLRVEEIRTVFAELKRGWARRQWSFAEQSE